MLVDNIALADLARGAAFLGSGGGGDPYYGQLVGAAELERGVRIELKPLDDFADDALIVPCGWIGAPTVSVEKLPSGREAIAGLRRIEEILGRRVDAVMPIEIGGGNGLAPLFGAAQLGVPIVDADGMGRAFPESQMAIFNIRGLSACPSVLTAACGSLTVIETPDNQVHERIARGLAVALGGIAHMVEYPLTGRQAKDHAIIGSVSAAIAAGAAIRLARAGGEDPFEALFAALRQSGLYPHAGVLFDGKIVDLERETRNGFSVGRVVIEHFEGGGRMELLFQNENLIARRDGQICAMVPDLITLMDRETADSITTERLKYGQRVKVVGAAAPDMLRERRALALVGPEAFGFPDPYVPIEQLNDWAGGMKSGGGTQYANAPVPDDQSVPGWRVALIIASFSIALPGFLNGAQTGLALGFRDAVLASLLSGLILCAGACLTAIISVRSRLTTYLLVQRSFGINGAALVNLVIAAIHYGWFGVNVSFFGGAMAAAVAKVYGVQGDFTLFVILGSVLMTVSTIFGFKMLERLALVAVPFLALILILVCYLSVRAGGLVLEPAAAPPVPMSFGVALSALIGANMLTVVAMPDLSRYIRAPRSAVLAMVLSFPFAAPLLMILAASTALATGQTDIMALVVQHGLGLPALAMLVLSSWTINAANLYSASLSLSATFPKVRTWVFTLVGGVIGAFFALIHIIDSFIPFLIFLGLIIPPVAAIYVIDGLTKFNDVDGGASLRDLPAIRWPAMATWAGSVTLALLAERNGFTATGVSAIDATLLAAIAYPLLLRLAKRR